MSFNQAKQLLYPGPIPAFMEADGANDVITLFGDYVTPAGQAAGDIVEMVVLPAGYVPVDGVFAFESIGATATVDIGLLSGNPGALLDVVGAAKVCGNEANAAANVAAPIIVRPTKKDFCLIAPYLGDPTTTPQTSGDRSFGYKILAGLATPVTGAKVRFSLNCRPRIDGV